LKNENEVCYNDEVHYIDETFVGRHNIVKDPGGVYAGPGIYSVNLKGLVLMSKAQTRKEIDPVWYLDRLRRRPELSEVFVQRKSDFVFPLFEKGGVMEYRTRTSRKGDEEYMTLMDNGSLRIKYGGPEKLFDIILHQGREYMISKEEGDYMYAHLIRN